jgi:outer membrane protein
MRLKQQIAPRLALGVATVLTLCLFASGRQVFASEQPPQPPPTTSTQERSTDQATGPELRITADEAVQLALENNIGIQTERLTPQMQAFALARAEGAFAPVLFSNVQRSSSTSPPTDFLSVGTATATSGNFRTDGGIQQQLRWGGGTYSLSMAGSRNTSDALRVVFSPQLNSSISASFTQPLLRNFTIDPQRQQVEQSRNQLDIAELQLAARLTQTARSVRIAYFDLVGAIGALDVARQSLELSRQSLRENQRRVEVGVMAEIDILEAQAEVALREEAVIIAENNIRVAEDALRMLILNPQQPDFWSVRIVPTETPSIVPQTVDVEAAIANALKDRTDLAQARTDLENLDLNIRFAETQRLPALNLSASYGMTGLGGVQNDWGGGVDELPFIVAQSKRSFRDVLRDVFSNDFPNWTVGVSFSYPIGTSSADAALAQSRLQRQQATMSLREQEMGVVTQVRNAARQVNTSQQRLEATRKAREFAERRLEAENKRLTVGLSTTFQLFQAQRDLDNAKQNELRALIDYNRALVNFEAVQRAPVGGM